jgi:hypothetical protein
MTPMTAGWLATMPTSSCSRRLGLDWSGAITLPRIGWEWAILGLNPNAARQRRWRRGRPCWWRWGQRPHGLTCGLRALTILILCTASALTIGTGMNDAGQVARRLVSLKSNYETVEGADDLAYRICQRRCGGLCLRGHRL